MATTVGASKNEANDKMKLEAGDMQKEELDSEIDENQVDCNMVLTIPREFMSLERLKIKEDEARGASPILLVLEEDEPEQGKIVFEKPTKKMTQHLKPLYIKVHIDGGLVNMVLVDNGATINIMYVSMLSKLAKIGKDLTPSDMVVNDFTKEATKTKGIIPIKVKLVVK